MIVTILPSGKSMIPAELDELEDNEDD